MARRHHHDDRPDRSCRHATDESIPATLSPAVSGWAFQWSDPDMEQGGDIRRANRREGVLHVREGPPGPERRIQPNAEHAERAVQH